LCLSKIGYIFSKEFYICDNVTNIDKWERKFNNSKAAITMKLLKTEQIIIIVLWLNIVASLYLNYSFNMPFIFGIIGLVIITVTYKKFYSISLAVLLFILLLSIFNVIPFSLAFGFNVGIISIPSVILFSVVVFKRKDEILVIKDKWFDEDPSETENRKANKIVFFKNQFKDLSIKELERKLANESLTDEAKEAINELLKDSF
jgi:predicted membrane protein